VYHEKRFYASICENLFLLPSFLGGKWGYVRTKTRERACGAMREPELRVTTTPGSRTFPSHHQAESGRPPLFGFGVPALLMVILTRDQLGYHQPGKDGKSRAQEGHNVAGLALNGEHRQMKIRPTVFPHSIA
jgi:hypothetical protein